MEVVAATAYREFRDKYTRVRAWTHDGSPGPPPRPSFVAWSLTASAPLRRTRAGRPRVHRCGPPRRAVVLAKAHAVHALDLASAAALQTIATTKGALLPLPESVLGCPRLSTGGVRSGGICGVTRARMDALSGHPSPPRLSPEGCRGRVLSARYLPSRKAAFSGHPSTTFAAYLDVCPLKPPATLTSSPAFVACPTRTVTRCALMPNSSASWSRGTLT